MQATQRGIVLRSVSLLPPIARVAQYFGFRSSVDRVVMRGVRDYQKYVSPYKGFCCAYRKLHGSESCSEFFRQTVQIQGLAAAIPLFQERLAACKQAHLTLKVRAQAAQAAEEESDNQQKQKQSQTSEPSTSSNDPCAGLAGCDCGAGSVDLGACSGGEQGFCDCDGFDAGGTHAGCRDCGNASACDVGSSSGDCGAGACDSCSGCDCGSF
jgi:putative component of membrane protein insertase Oxa1/YidC/SpoIIIJ protein YidD